MAKKNENLTNTQVKGKLKNGMGKSRYKYKKEWNEYEAL